jgi:hypothetical protein
MNLEFFLTMMNLESDESQEEEQDDDSSKKEKTDNE